jgi:hypothetical protein
MPEPFQEGYVPARFRPRWIFTVYASYLNLNHIAFMNTFKSLSTLVIMGGALLLTSCNTSKEEVAPKPVRDLSFEYAERIPDPTAAAEAGGRVQAETHVHNFSIALSTGGRFGDEDYNMRADGCSLVNGTGTAIARTDLGQRIINQFPSVGTSRSPSPNYPGYVMYTCLFGNGRVWFVYYFALESGGNFIEKLFRDCAVRVVQ